MSAALLTREAEELKAQRDMLLVACRKLIDWDDSRRDPNIGDSARMFMGHEAFEMARAAVSDVEASS